MKQLKSRLEALESIARPGAVERWHQVIQRVGQTRDEALDEYGRGKVGEHDGVIVRKIVAPSFDADGKMILGTAPRAEGLER